LPGTPKACYCVEEAIPEITAIRFQEDSYIDAGNGNDSNYVWITNPGCDGVNFMWNNKAGEQWSLTAVMNGDQFDYFDVGTDCPYYETLGTEFVAMDPDSATQSSIYRSGENDAKNPLLHTQDESIRSTWDRTSPYACSGTSSAKPDWWTANFTNGRQKIKEVKMLPNSVNAFELENVDILIDGVLCGTTPDSMAEKEWVTVTCAGDGLWGESIKLYRDTISRPLMMCGIKVVGYTGHTQAELSYDGERISAISGPWSELYTAHTSFTT
jgi:hypothetical protein